MARMVIRSENVRKLLEVFEEFIEEKEAAGCVDKTIKGYRDSLRKFCNYLGYSGETLCSEVTKQEIIRYTKYLNSHLAPASVNHELRNIRAFMYFVGVDYKISLVHEGETLPKCYTDEELEAYLKKPRTEEDFSTWRTWAVINTIYATGLRAGSICELKVEDVDFESGLIAVRKTKTKKVMYLPLSASLEKALKEYMRIWRNNCPKDRYLFPTVRDEKIDRNSLYYALKRYGDKRGLKRHSIHSFRRPYVKHTTKKYSLQKQKSQATVSDNLGFQFFLYHSSESMSFIILKSGIKLEKSNRSNGSSPFKTRSAKLLFERQ